MGREAEAHLGENIVVHRPHFFKRRRIALQPRVNLEGHQIQTRLIAPHFLSRLVPSSHLGQKQSSRQIDLLCRQGKQRCLVPEAEPLQLSIEEMARELFDDRQLLFVEERSRILGAPVDEVDQRFRI